MAASDSTYYSLTRLRDMSPDARDWAAVDLNFEIISSIFKFFEQHHHSGVSAITYPGYYPTPTAPTVTPTGTLGTTTYTYYIVAKGLTPERISAQGSTNTGYATLSGTNYNALSWPAVAGATGYDVIRVTGGTSQGSISLNQVGTTLSDTGLTAAAYNPSRQPTITANTSGGILAPGTTVGVRLSYVNALGLETDSCPEVTYTLPTPASRPLSPQLVSTTASTPGLPGGTYLYVLTKVKGSGETTISDPLPVTIPFDASYSVTCSFNPVNSYTDGTTGINVYRTTGLSSAFQLVGQITSASQTQFTDNNTTAPALLNLAPPASSTFDATNKLTIDWTSINTYPADASKLRVYVTRQPGVWGTSHLLKEVDLLNLPPNYVDYVGSETLGSGWPKNSTEIPSSPAKLNLGTEATGAPTLTADMNFANFKAQNFKAGDPPTTPQNGNVWYDYTSNKLRAQINGSTIDLNNITNFVNYVRTPSWEYSAFTTGDAVFTSLNLGVNNDWLTRVTTGPIRGTGSLGAEVKGNVSGAPAVTWRVQFQGSGCIAAASNVVTTLANAPNQLATVVAGQSIWSTVSYQVKAGTGPNSGATLSNPNTLVHEIWYWDGTGAIVGTSTLSVVSSFTSGTTATVSGFDTVPAGAVYAGVAVQVSHSINTSAYILFDDVALVPGQSVGTAPVFFNGDTGTGYIWLGTAGHSFSERIVNYTHPALEVGGHDASHIVIGTNDVSNFLKTRYANTNGSHKQVIVPIVRKTANGSGLVTTSTTPDQTFLGLSATIGSFITDQWFDATFAGSFVIQNAGATASFQLYLNGNAITETQFAKTAATPNESFSVSIPWVGQILGSGSNVFDVRCWVTSGNLTAPAYRQYLWVKLVL